MKKTVFIVTVALLVGISVGAICMNYLAVKSQRHFVEIYQSNYEENMLYALSNEVDLMTYVVNHYANDPLIKEKVEYILVLQLYIISLGKPQISKLQDTPLHALCDAIKFESTNKYQYVNDSQLTSPVKIYFHDIKHTVINTIQQRDNQLSNVLTKNAEMKLLPELSKNRLQLNDVTMCR